MYSVLMSVYKKENPVFLQQAMSSIWEQTIQPDEFVLVCDGPLTPELDVVIKEMERQHLDSLHVVRLADNGGLGNALNIGIQHCSNKLIARMDSDDISRPDRCEKQLRVFEKDPELDICCGTIEEFFETPEEIVARRVLPEQQDDILCYAKKRNPFNHMAVMYKKEAVLMAGGYQPFYLLEDYYLWVRMLLNGAKGYNLQEPLVWVRTGLGMYKRRGGWDYACSQLKLLNYMKAHGMIGDSEYYTSCIIRGIAALAPNRARGFLYEHFLRE